MYSRGIRPKREGATDSKNFGQRTLGLAPSPVAGVGKHEDVVDTAQTASKDRIVYS